MLLSLRPFYLIWFTMLFVFGTGQVLAQKNQANIMGKVVDENENPIPKVSVMILGKLSGVVTSDSGKFKITVPSDKALALVFSFSGYRSEQRNFFLSDQETENIIVRMEKSTKTMDAVVITAQTDRRETGLIRMNPKNALVIPSTIGGIESLIKIFVGSNNELTSQYSVRGGSYDENLIYVNDFEVFRPYLVRSGQQEGLSFINPELTGRMSFYTGGFQAKYGDKLSSVLDIQYKKPIRTEGSAYISLMEQGFHFEGSEAKGKFTYLIGLRNRNNRGLLSSQQTKGSYIPSSADIQALITYAPWKKWQFETLMNLSGTKFTLIPEQAQITSSVFSATFSANLGLDIYFDGREEDRYSTNMLGFSAQQQVNSKLRLKWMVSRFSNDESERYDIAGAYLFGERSFDRSKSDFGLIVNPLGAGVTHQFARNMLNITNWNATHKGQYNYSKHSIQWGISAENTIIQDRLNEWERQDSAGYTLPYDDQKLILTKTLKSSASLNINRFSGYIQDNFLLDDKKGIMVSGGVRFNYNDLNNQLVLSPRFQASWKPQTAKDVVFKLAGGAYNQPPFYRELRRYDGTINKSLKAQNSWQAVAGIDYNFIAWERPFRLSTEAYYKTLNNVVTYDLDNVRIRYSGENDAKAYATGLEMRLTGEWVKDAESWISLGFMKTMENLFNDKYNNYYNAAGELIKFTTEDQEIVDSVQMSKGWVRRPTDRLITLGLFFQDYLSTNKNFKVHLNLLYGSNMPYNIPGSIKYRNALIIDPYIRADIGFSALLLDSEKSIRRSHSPFRDFQNIWMSFEVFNMLDRRNTISYLLIKDFSNTIFSMPNRLTPRLVNLKLVARF